jgi:hypothetical protein
MQQRQRQPTPINPQTRPEKLFFSSLPSEFTKLNYNVLLKKYFVSVGYGKEGITELVSKAPKVIEDDLIDFIISLKERGAKHSTIINYVKRVIKCCKANEIMLNIARIHQFVPKKNPRNRNTTKAYTIPQIQAMLDIADERMKVVILLQSSA